MRNLFSYNFKAIFTNLVYKKLKNFTPFKGLDIYLTPTLVDILKVKSERLYNNFTFPIFNPSIIKFKNKVYFISRCNKPKNNKTPYEYDGINFIHECNANLKVSKITLLDDTLLKKKLRKGFNGLEDIRLFIWKNSIWGIGASIYYKASYDNNFCREFKCNQVLIKIEGNKITEFYELKSPFNKYKEKNWTPVVKNEQLFFLYSIKPLLVLQFLNKKLKVIKSDSGKNLNQIYVRGGTTIVELANRRMIGVGHKAPIKSFGSLFYKHLFYMIDDEFNLKMLSKEFFIEKKGLEFPCGLFLNGKNIVMSYGSVKQDMSMYCKIPLHKLKFFNINI
jgi:hypothetical protein